MVNKKHTILFIFLFVTIAFVLGLFFRKVDFAYIKDKYEDETNQIESSGNLNSNVASQNSYNIAFTANDFRKVYFQSDSVTRDGITISGGNFIDPSLLGYVTEQEQVATTLSISHDKSIKSIESISLDLLLPIDNFFTSNKLDSLNKSVYLSWPLIIDIDNQEVKTSTSIQNSYINVFDLDKKALDYVAPLSQVLNVISPSFDESKFESIKNTFSKFEIASVNSYKRNSLIIEPSINSLVRKSNSKPIYVYYASILGTKQQSNGGGLLFNRQLSSYASNLLNESEFINSSSMVGTIEQLASKQINLDIDIYNAYDMPMQDDLILYDEIKSGLDDDYVDLKLLLSNKTQSYYIPLSLDSSAFYIGSPREIECCTPDGDEVNEASSYGSDMLTAWLNNPTITDTRTFSYVMYYGMKFQLIGPLFDRKEDGDSACGAKGCQPWTRYEPLPYLEDESYMADQVNVMSLNSVNGSLRSSCSPQNAIKPGGNNWVHGVPGEYPIWPTDSTTSGDIMGSNGNSVYIPKTLTGTNKNQLTLNYLESLTLLNQATGPDTRDTIPACNAYDFIPIIRSDSNAYPNASEVNGDKNYACYNFKNCQDLVFKETPQGETGRLYITYPDVDQVSSVQDFSLYYTYNEKSHLATYSNIIEATNAVNAQIANQLALGEASPNSLGIRPGSTYAEIENIIWENIELYGWSEYANLVTPENVQVVFYEDVTGSKRIHSNVELKYGAKPNNIYYAFQTKNSNILTLPGTVETLAPFTIQDTTGKDYSPSALELSAGSACVNSLVSSKFGIWDSSTTMGTIKNEIWNNESFNCLAKFGLAAIKSSLTLSLYKDEGGAMPYDDSELMGEITIDNPKQVYYRYELSGELNWWETFSMPMQSFILQPGSQSIYLPGNETVVANAIQDQLKSIALENESLTYGQVMGVVQTNAKGLVVEQAANSIGINYYDINGNVVTDIDPNDYFTDGNSFKFDIYLATPVPGYVYWDDMIPLEILLDWDSTHTIVANTVAASKIMPTYIETETITNAQGDTMLVADDSWNYSAVKSAISVAFDTLFSESDAKYIDKDSLSLKDNGVAYDDSTMLLSGSHVIEYRYELNTYNCSWFDITETCHIIDGVNLQGFDGVSNVFEFEVYEIVSLDPEVVARANATIAELIAAEIDTNGDGNVDPGNDTTYYKIVEIIETVLEEENAFESNYSHFRVEVRAVFNNSIGRPEYFVIDESNIGNIVATQVTGFQYRVVESNSRELWFTDPSAYGYYTTWTGNNYHPPVEAGRIFGDGVMYWLIIGSFIALIGAGIGVGTYFIAKRRREIASLSDLEYIDATSKKKKTKKDNSSTF